MILAYIIAGLGLLFGFGAAEVHRFENAAAHEIQGKLQGEHSRVEVHTKTSGIFEAARGELRQVDISASDFSTPGLPLHTEPERSKRGRVRQLNLVLSNFYLAGLRVDSLQATIPECRFDLGLAMKKGTIRLSQSGVGTGNVQIKDSDLGAYILKKFHDIKQATVRIKDGKVDVRGYGEFILLKSDFHVVADLLPTSATQISLANAEISFHDQPAERASAEMLMKTLNPVVDLDRDLKLEGAISLRGVRLRDGWLEAWGDTRIPEATAH